MLLLVLALASCTSSTPTPVDESTSTAGEQATATAGDRPTATADERSAAATVDDPRADAKLLQDFTERLDKYVSVRQKADDNTPPLKRTTEPGEIKAAQDALAQRIRTLNANAKHGDVFSPEISADLKRLLRPEVADKGTKEAIKDDAPESVPYLKVNAVYPENEPLSTVPPNVLMTLPTLPKDIEYRFVGRHMILRDARANLIIDYIPNAMP
jgi:hypothetical protein